MQVSFLRGTRDLEVIQGGSDNIFVNFSHGAFPPNRTSFHSQINCYGVNFDPKKGFCLRKLNNSKKMFPPCLR